MTCIPGRLAKVQLSANGGSSYVGLGAIVDVTMNVNIDELECTTHDSDGAREYIPNHHDVTLDVSARWLDGDPGQEMLLDSAFAKTSLNFIFTMQTLTGKKKFTGTCFPTTASPGGPLDETGSFDVTLRCSGVVKATQA